MVKLAAMNGVLPLLYHNLKTPEGILENVVDRMRSAYLWTVGENVRKGGETIKVLAQLRENDVEAVPLKGPVASDVIFGNPGLYPSGDLDVLVKPADLERTKKLLLDAGYREGEATEADMLESSYHINFQKDRYFLEVHWNLTFRYFDVPPDFWWEDTRVAQYQGVEVLALSPERYLLYTIFRLYSHAFRPLRFIVLVTEIIRRYEKEVNWQKLFDLSSTHKMERLVRFALKLSHDLLGCPVPGEVLTRRFCGFHSLKRLVLSGLFSDVKKIHRRMLLFTTLQQTPLDTLRVLFRRVFPLAAEIRLRYRLPADSKKIYLYYLLNPFLLFFKKTG